MAVTNSPYQTCFQTHLQAITAHLDTLLSRERNPQVLWQAMRHGVLNGGKRIRPVLLLEVCLASGGKLEQALPTACALELVHCFSLIHDDLPCMDDDDWRRGQPTVHKAFSEGVAVLAGDALVAMAFGVITDQTREVAPEKLLQVISELAWASSVEGLVNGQVDDIEFANHAPSEDILYRIHRGKTGALFRFACRAGGILSGLSAAQVDQLGQFGEDLGIAFQIVDDLLDIQSSSQVLGKTAGKDQAQGKITFPAVYGEDGARAQLGACIARLNQALDRLAPVMETEKLRFLVRFIKERES